MAMKVKNCPYWLKVWPTDFDHFLFVASKEIESLENINDGIDSCKNTSFLFNLYYLSEWNKTGGHLQC